MDARAVLESVARTYANLKTLSVEILSVSETSDEGSSERATQRTKTWFEAPDKARVERSGRQGMVQVTDGASSHYYDAPSNRYFRRAALWGESFPGLFKPGYGSLGGPPFLFSRIADGLSSAKILAEEPGAFLISVTYEPPADSRWWLSSPVQYRIDSGIGMVLRIDGEVSTRMSPVDAVLISKHSISFENSIVDQPVSPEVFKFYPPTKAVEASGRSGVAFRGAVGSALDFDFRDHKYEWVGEILVERYKLRVHGIDLRFERRLTFSVDRRELTVSERIIGPAGETTHQVTLPLG